MNKATCLLALAASTLVTLSFSAAADETGGCESFAWSVATELQWMKAADSEAVTSGAKLQALPAKAISLSLQPMDRVPFPVAPTSRRKSNGERYGGVVTFDSVGDPGVYQMSLPVAGWVDAVQDGKALKSVAHSGKKDCDGIRKSVRFNVGPGPLTIEISGIPTESLKFAIKRSQ